MTLALPPVPPPTTEATHRSIQGNRNKNTKPELLVRSYLREAGLTGYRLQWKKAPGRPDIAFVNRRVAVLVNGCFWHRCPYCSPSRPRTHADFWDAKFSRNRERDARNHALLVEQGWTVIVVWECRLKKKRVRRTMQEVIAEVRLATPIHLASERRPGRIIVVGSRPVRGPRGLAAERVRVRARAARGGLGRHGRG